MSKKKRIRSKGREEVSVNPGWIKREICKKYIDDNFSRIFVFYVINTPCEKLSSSAKPLSDYGWGKEVWKRSDTLKDRLLDIANLNKAKESSAIGTFATTEKLNEMKAVFCEVGLSGNFHKQRDEERVAVYKPTGYNEFMSIFYHIRNAFAHGRFSIYPIKNANDIMFALEDGLKSKEKFQVRSRMLLKRSTLLKWIDIIEGGPQQLQQQAKQRTK